MKIPIKFNNRSFGKFVLAVVWTCFLMFVSYVIVEGESETTVEGYSGKMTEGSEKITEEDGANEVSLSYEAWKEQDDMDVKEEEIWSESLVTRLLELESPFFQYTYEGITETEQKEKSSWNFGWDLAEYLEEEQTEKGSTGKSEVLAKAEETLLQQGMLQKDFPFLAAEGYFEDETTDCAEEEETEAVMASAVTKIKELKESKSTDYLLRNFYIVDSTTSVDSSVFQVENLLKKDMTLEKSDEPQILIYHTHGATEGFVNQITGEMVSVIEVGERLAEILEETYGYNVIHDDTPYDMVNGSVDRNKAYNQSLDGVEKLLKQYPSIQVVIDLHRDGIGSEDKRTTVIEGKRTAKFMFFNGLSRNKQGNIDYLYNPKLEGNLAFSLQLKLKAMELYPTITRPNYLKGYRYNLHLRERSLLIELGNQNNSSGEAMNALEPMAKILDAVLQGK